MAIKVEKYAVGDKLPMMCSACDSDQDHTVQTVTKLGKITSAVCDVCQTSSTFKSRSSFRLSMKDLMRILRDSIVVSIRHYFACTNIRHSR